MNIKGFINSVHCIMERYEDDSLYSSTDALHDIAKNLKSLLRCPSCNKVLKPLDKYCSECGRKAVWNENY